MARTEAPRESILHADRCFDPDPATRRVARELFEEMRALPTVSPHGHVDVEILASNRPFTDPAGLIVTPDHYVLRMLHSQGVSLESLGVARLDGAAVETDPRAIWRAFARNYHLFRGTPSGYWTDYQLHETFGVEHRLDADTADRSYDHVAERLASPEFLPRALFDRFGIEVLATTDAATSSLEHHRAIRESGWHGRVIPTFRPDALFRIADRAWIAEVETLQRATGHSVETFDDFLGAIEARRQEFITMRATATDHGVTEPWTGRLSPPVLAQLFERARSGRATADDQRGFQGHMLLEMARMSVQDGLVMQLHAGAWRNHDTALARDYGPDRGGDIPVAIEFTANLHALLNEFGSDPRFTLVVFTLDESTYSRELAPLAGHYPAMRLGPPWWFHDSMQGMTRFREQTIGTAGIWNTAGFNDDARGFCSIPARHDLARRTDANFLAGLVARHVLDMGDARVMARAMAYDLARATYRLDA